MSVTLCVLFNHPYPDNIPKIKEILKGKFSDIIFVQPLLGSSDPDVVTSYRGSYSFHGLVVDAAEILLKKESNIFVFMQDDVLLNPKISEENVADILKLGEGGAFLPDFNEVGGDIQQWHWTSSVIWRLFYPLNVYSGSGVENICKYLPDATAIRKELVAKYGFSLSPVTYDRNVSLLNHKSVEDQKQQDILNRAVLDGLFATTHDGKTINLPYPFCYGLSDFFAVDRATFKRLIPVLGALAAAQVFAEVAIPTALVSVADRVVRSADIGLRPNWVWGEQRSKIDSQLTAQQFHRDLLLIHPIKFSQEIELAKKIIASFDEYGFK